MPGLLRVRAGFSSQGLRIRNRCGAHPVTSREIGPQQSGVLGRDLGPSPKSLLQQLLKAVNESR